MSPTENRSTKKMLQKQSQKIDRDNGQFSERNEPQAFIRMRKAPLAAGSTSTLERMPLEIRKEILKYLLLNPELGTISCIHSDEGWGSKIKYELQPAILRVCKEFHAEGVEMLYGENWFFIECVLPARDHLLHRYALTRFCEVAYPESLHSSRELAINHLKTVPGVKRIGHWKISIAPMRINARNNVINLCRSICHNGIKSMKFVIAPWDNLEYPNLSRAGTGGSAAENETTAKIIQHVLSPLEILRCAGKVVIRGADPEEVPDFLFRGDRQGYDYYSWVSGSLWRIATPRGMDIYELKILRSNAIQFLERQYQRIQQAANDLVRFVKDQKVSGGLLDPVKPSPFESSPGVQSEGLVLLKKYAESFDRDLTTATKIAICRLNGQYEMRFEVFPREIAIKKCTNAYRGRDVEAFVANFKYAVDDLDIQYLPIRNARKRLFEWDLKGPGYTAEIDVEPLRCDEKIAWDKVEPDVDVKKAEILE
ncbi:hypothetical protein BOTNAR_0755g00020 [Botryotinia narcissicola]|uniref:F-box domain-containing protein n=1 Tax=Botryotinia narcissicola TaxID=278944 RepID=A0A4Z1H6I9_9HELO|nr:hypothetical protein BOTNAR_0755g00020 [Botryotinia narcissicola]